MRDLMTYVKVCTEQLDKVGVPYSKNILEWKINTRAKSRWGQCKKTIDGYIIEVSVDLLNEENDVEGLKNTIIHELIHTCDGCNNHGTLWKMYAAMVNSAYGYNIKRSSTCEEKGVNYEVRKKSNAKYVLECSECHQQFYYQRTCFAVKHPEFCSHKGCHGNLKRIFDWRINNEANSH